MNRSELRKKASAYALQVVILATLLHFGIRLWGPDSVQTPSAWSYAFVMLFYLIDGGVWLFVTSRYKEYLTSFFTGTSGFRFLLALAVIGVYYWVYGSAAMMSFLLVFMAYYLLLLAHHSIFFSRVSNRL